MLDEFRKPIRMATYQQSLELSENDYFRLLILIVNDFWSIFLSVQRFRPELNIQQQQARVPCECLCSQEDASI